MQRIRTAPSGCCWVLGILGESSKADLNLISQICCGKDKPSLQLELCNSVLCELRNMTIVFLPSLPTFPRFWIFYLCVVFITSSFQLMDWMLMPFNEQSEIFWVFPMEDFSPVPYPYAFSTKSIKKMCSYY